MQMETTIQVDGNATKDETYRQLYPQLQGLISGEPDLIDNLSNIVSALKTAMAHYSWVGFYLRYGDTLVLGPFQGKPACVSLTVGKGVCGTSAVEARTVVVPNVYEFPGHVFCDAESKSEIVVPLVRSGKVVGVIDVDSHEFNQFDDVDARWLEQVAGMVTEELGGPLDAYRTWAAERMHEGAS